VLQRVGGHSIAKDQGAADVARSQGFVVLGYIKKEVIEAAAGL
jgi:hypothetical protein